MSKMWVRILTDFKNVAEYIALDCFHVLAGLFCFVKIKTTFNGHLTSNLKLANRVVVERQKKSKTI